MLSDFRPILVDGSEHLANGDFLEGVVILFEESSEAHLEI